MASAPSITSTRAFAARLLAADQWRIALMAACLAVVLLMWLVRRAMGGVVATTDSLFYSTLAILGAALLLLGLGFADTAQRRRRGGVLPWWKLIASVALDLAVPLGLLLILQLHSPRGAYAALSAPVLLLIPIVLMLSVLRLRPAFSLITGFAAAAGHWALALRAASVAGLHRSDIPVVMAYGVLIALTGVGAAVLALFVRRYIQEAVREAEAAERAGRALATMEHELEIAREIQLGLLPSTPPELPAFDVAGLSRPATQAGGDYYDWQPLPDGRLVVAIADVTGHGIGPALVMAVCRAYARATAPTTAGAADFLERLNGLIVGDVSGGRFITMAVLVVSPDGAVEMLSAGHGPTFLYRKATGEVEQFGGDGLPLGVLAGEQYTPTKRLYLGPGDAIVLLTDGFMERSRADDELFGSDRLERVIASCATRPAAEIIAEIDRAVAEFAGGTVQADDMTAVVVRRI